MRYFYMTLLVSFVAVILIFSVQNAKSVTVSFLMWRTTLPRFVVVIGAYLLGMASGGSVSAFLRHSMEGAKRKPTPPESQP
jgi:uncharacterized integral membrane protein